MADVSLELIQAMLQRVLDGQAVLAREMQELKARLSAVEQALLSVRRDLVLESEARFGIQRQVDHLDERVARIERRLELTEAAH